MATGAAVASAAVGVGNYFGGKDAEKSSEKNSQYADALAAQQQQYQQNMMNQYQANTRANVDYVNNLQWGDYMYTPTAENGGLLNSGNMAQASAGHASGNNQAGIQAAQGMLDDWSNTFGGLEDNLSDYYNNLDPNKFAVQNKAALQQNLDKSMQQFNDTMAASGLQSSGMKQQAAKEAAFAQAQGNAGIDINAPEQVAQMQQGFLNYGKSFKEQGQQLLGSATNLDSSLKTQASVANANNQTQANIANASAQNQFDMYNANTLNTAGRTNADLMNANQNRYNESMMDAWSKYDDSYLLAGSMNNPMIDRYDTKAQNYGKSQAGYNAAAGNAFGSAMNYGIQAYGQ